MSFQILSNIYDNAYAATQVSDCQNSIGEEKELPANLVFDVVSEGDEGSYKYESSIRDLHRSIRSIIKDHRSKRGRLVNLYWQWLGNRTGRIFTAIIGTQIVLMIFHLISAFS